MGALEDRFLLVVAMAISIFCILVVVILSLECHLSFFFFGRFTIGRIQTSVSGSCSVHMRTQKQTMDGLQTQRGLFAEFVQGFHELGSQKGGHDGIIVIVQQIQQAWSLVLTVILIVLGLVLTVILSVLVLLLVLVRLVLLVLVLLLFVLFIGRQNGSRTQGCHLGTILLLHGFWMVRGLVMVGVLVVLVAKGFGPQRRPCHPRREARQGRSHVTRHVLPRSSGRRMGGTQGRRRLFDRTGHVFLQPFVGRSRRLLDGTRNVFLQPLLGRSRGRLDGFRNMVLPPFGTGHGLGMHRFRLRILGVIGGCKTRRKFLPHKFLGRQLGHQFLGMNGPCCCGRRRCRCRFLVVVLLFHLVTI